MESAVSILQQEVASIKQEFASINGMDVPVFNRTVDTRVQAIEA